MKKELFKKINSPDTLLSIAELSKGKDLVITVGSRKHPVSNSEVKEFRDSLGKFIPNSRTVIVNGSFCTVKTTRRKKHREIKFRQRKEWHSFTEGHVPEKDYWHYWGFINGKFIQPMPHQEDEEPIHDEYTGLKDKNGKEIYEGDIVSFENLDSVIIEWDVKHASVVGKIITTINDEFPTYCNFAGFDLWQNPKVIGNIHDNPGLLKEET